ncbi:LuxR family transcriptional regulator [Microlunatus spumicola]|uniref:LuxR family transcriptional regulator n=1 Tax=Microlunatus spumicola TaxID=81499 RepID=A0ABP6WTN3_9ACTN
MQRASASSVRALRTVDDEGQVARPLTGRQREVDHLRASLSEVSRAGRAVVISGEAGIGKTALAEVAEAYARHLGFVVLRCDAVERERSIGYSGLHQLLQPVLHLRTSLPPRQQQALETVFGLDESDEAPTANQLLVGIATLGLLEEAGSPRPVLLLVEDLQWLDRSSGDVLGFVARRLGQARVVLVATLRDGDLPSTTWLGPPIEHLRLGPITARESEELLDQLPVRLPPPARARVLREARGNPLALLELSTELQERGLAADAELLPELPLSRRLEDGFMQQVHRLPGATQRFLLVAVASGDAPFSEVVAAATELGLSPADLAPAELVGLVRVDAQHLRFRHPLVRSAVYNAAPIAERLAVHRALASTLQPHRGAWHLAAATPDRDESVAETLTAIAEDAAYRGAQAEASMAFERAAALSVDPSLRLRRLVEAAETARLAGVTSASRLADAARPLLIDPTAEPALAVRAAITRWRLGADDGQFAARVEELVEIAERLGGPDGTAHPQERTRALVAVAVGLYVLQPAEGLRRRALAALTALERHHELDVQGRVALILLDPLGNAARWRGRLQELDGAKIPPNRLAYAAEAIQDLPGATALWAAAAELTGRAREVSEEGLALHGRALIRILAGDLTGSLASAEVAQRASSEVDLENVRPAALLVSALAHVWLGDLPQAAAEIERAQAISSGAPLGRKEAELHWAAGMLALAEHRHWDAWVRLRQVGSHPTFAAWSVADLTEAAVQTGKVAEVTVVLQQLERDNETYASPHLAMLLHRSRALLADGAAAGDEFRAAIAAGTGSGAPLELARTRLAYGMWLRRQRRESEAREPLAEALGTFDTAGAKRWAERAAAELRAAGAPVVNRRHDAPDQAVALLTAQELQIAGLAAEGLTNKEIATQIYLSHRTVGAHLYRVFPKLGITSRAQLRAALGR